MRRLGYEPAKDFAPIILVGSCHGDPANPSFAGNSMAELIAAAKAAPDKIDIALPSTTARIVFELLKERTGAPLFGVPYKGSATAMTEISGGQVPLIIDTVTALRGHVAAGKLKALGDHDAEVERADARRKVGRRAGRAGLRGDRLERLYAPRGTPRAVIDLLNAELAKASWPSLRRGSGCCSWASNRLGHAGCSRPVRGAGAAKWGPVIKATGLQGG